MPDLTRETLAELRRLDAERTPGEWEAQAYGTHMVCHNGFSDRSYQIVHHGIRIGRRDYALHSTEQNVVGLHEHVAVTPYEGEPHPDAALIALVVNNLPALLAAAERGLGAGDGR